jgi:hypothetical protein
MLFALIPVIWLAIAAFAVLLCRGAANADAALIASAEQPCGPRVTRGNLSAHGYANRVWRAPTRSRAPSASSHARRTRV